MKKKSTAFDYVNTILLILLALVCIYPFLNILCVSLSDGKAVMAGKVYIWPADANIYAYKYILSSPRLGVLQALWNSVWYTGVGTVVAVFVTFMSAYVLSRKRFKASKVIMTLFLITYVFEAGLIPNYIINRSLGLVNNPLIMILPPAINTFYLIISKSFLNEIPESIEEAAFIDGANDFQIFSKIFFPISKPSIATIALFYAVTRWNDFLNPLIYLQNDALKPLQLILYSFCISTDRTGSMLENVMVNGVMIMHSNIADAMIFLTIIPIVIAYPFAQKYFTKGILVGSVKE
jgi:putative aldouronate transport system permease protein